MRVHGQQARRGVHAAREEGSARSARIDPACGSGHFLLYAFDVLLAIYEEAYADPESPKREETGKTLAEDYPSLDALRKAIPGLVLAYNLHGVDIDARCAQIAQLALWMRAQKAYRDFGIGRLDRLPIRRSNIVVAEPLITDDKTANEFVIKLGDVELGRIFKRLVESLRLAGDLGILLRLETLVTTVRKQGDLFAPAAERIRAALDQFIHEEVNATNARRRLFADDAAHGLALLGLAEKQYDAVLMNPPFGEASQSTHERISAQSPEWGGNILCAFVSRSAELLAPGGFVGAIFDRTVNVKSSYEEHRRRWMLSEGFATRLIVELGWEVLDANVEVCAAVSCRGAVQCSGLDLRQVAARDKAAELLSCLADSTNWNVRPLAGMRRLPNAVMSPDFPDYLVRVLGRSPTLSDAGLVAYSGYSLKADQHYRLWWEAPCRPGRLSTFFRMPMFNGSAFEPFTTSFLEAAVSHVPPEQLPPSTTTRVLNTQVRGLPGVCFGKRGEFLTAHVLPAGFLFTQEGRPLPVGDWESVIDLVGYLNTTIIRAALNLFAGQHKTSGYVNMLPWEPPLERETLRELVLAAIHQRLRMQAFSETDRLFRTPGSLTLDTIGSLAACLIEDIKLATEATLEAERAWQQALEIKFEVTESDRSHLATLAQQQPAVRISTGLTELTSAAYASSLLSWAVGVSFGRFDVRLATGAPELPPQADPFARLPDCSPGMLTGVDGQHPVQAPMEYPITIPADGILVDDSGTQWDLSAAVRGVFGVVFREEGNSRLSEAAALLDSKGDDVNDWLRIQFFSAHVQRYTKSRRKAPIYWQLSTPSGSYSVWLYIHASNSDSFFRIQNAHVVPKLAYEERKLEALSRELDEQHGNARRKAIAEQESIVEELRSFLEEVKRVAPLWNPDLDDGVIINFAPLWRLVPLNKAWQNELVDTWQDLCKGEYDWAHLAMHLWPERVVPKCARDRSLAIAHGLEDIFWVQGTDGRWTTRETPTCSVDQLVTERTSPAVKSALKSLLEAPAAAGKSGRRRRGSRRKSAAAAEGGDA